VRIIPNGSMGGTPRRDVPYGGIVLAGWGGRSMDGTPRRDVPYGGIVLAGWGGRSMGGTPQRDVPYDSPAYSPSNYREREGE